MSKYFAAMDAGCYWITVIAARWSRSGDYVLEGFSRSRANGFRGGVITDIASATDAVTEAMTQLRKKTGRRIHDIYAGISSASVDIIPSSGMLLLSKYGREISDMDIKKCVNIGSTVKISLDKEPVHRIVRGFSVDGEKEIKDPLSLEGVKLEARMNILTMNSSALRNMSKCISQAGYVPAGFIFSGLAASYRSLTSEDRENGVLLLEVCRDMTKAIIFSHGTLNSCKVFSVGTDDILTRTSEIDRDKLQKLTSSVVRMPGWDRVDKIVVAGEGTLKDDLIERMEEFFKVTVIAGSCIAKPFEDLPPDRMGYVNSLGMLDYLQEERHQRKASGNIIKRCGSRFMNFIDKYF